MSAKLFRLGLLSDQVVFQPTIHWAPCQNTGYALMMAHGQYYAIRFSLAYGLNGFVELTSAEFGHRMANPSFMPEGEYRSDAVVLANLALRLSGEAL